MWSEDTGGGPGPQTASAGAARASQCCEPTRGQENSQQRLQAVKSEERREEVGDKERGAEEPGGYVISDQRGAGRAMRVVEWARRRTGPEGSCPAQEAHELYPIEWIVAGN